MIAYVLLCDKPVVSFGLISHWRTVRYVFSFLFQVITHTFHSCRQNYEKEVREKYGYKPAAKVFPLLCTVKKYLELLDSQKTQRDKEGMKAADPN